MHSADVDSVVAVELPRVVGFFVEGLPLPKGSKTLVGRPGRRYMIESADIARKCRPPGSLKRWSDRISAEAREYDGEPMSGAVEMRLTFYLPRPKTVKRRYPTVKPDIDKLARAVQDALNGIVYRDDAQVVSLSVHKRYCGAQPSGVVVFAREFSS